MAFLSSLDISGSALTAQKLRMNIVAQNLANADSIVTATGEAYRRKSVVLSEKTDDLSFSSSLDQAMSINGGVVVSEIYESDEAFIMEYDPGNPLANEEGYVQRPSINTVEEMIEMISASRNYEANVTVFNAVKDMAVKALEIGR
ncbi:MAG TPA: flagellar basal body rod protein FlgC [Clostridiales bacterium]|nr:flagellar basal body rod protein FlgC [Eubacteriales bacterium]HBR32915.1 flagellar basal body rod protein FlgC [Clostridiales bacterium]